MAHSDHKQIGSSASGLGLKFPILRWWGWVPRVALGYLS